MAQFTIVTQGLDRLKDHFQRLAPALKQAQRNTVVRLSLLMEARLKQAASGELLHPRTGAYRDSIGSSSVETDAGGVQVRSGIRAGAASKYARLQEEGGTIRPLGHPLLSIPLDDAKTGAGVSRYKSPLEVPGDTTWIFPKGRNPLFVEKDENDEIDKVLFVGVTEVTIPGKHPVGHSFDDVAPLAPRIGQEELDRAIETAFAA